MPALIGLILGGALDLGGAAVGAAGAQQSKYGMVNALNSDIGAMQQYGKQGLGLFNQGLQGSTLAAANQDIASGQQQFTNAANSADQAAPGFATPLSKTSKAIDTAKAGMGAQAMGNYAGYSNLPLQWNLMNQTLWPQLSIINQQAAARNALLPTALQSGAQAGQGLTSLSHLLFGLGSLGMGVGGLAGGGAGAAGSLAGTGSDIDAMGGYSGFAPTGL